MALINFTTILLLSAPIFGGVIDPSSGWTGSASVWLSRGGQEVTCESQSASPQPGCVFLGTHETGLIGGYATDLGVLTASVEALIPTDPSQPFVPSQGIATSSRHYSDWITVTTGGPGTFRLEYQAYCNISGDNFAGGGHGASVQISTNCPWEPPNGIDIYFTYATYPYVPFVPFHVSYDISISSRVNTPDYGGVTIWASAILRGSLSADDTQLKGFYSDSEMLLGADPAPVPTPEPGTWVVVLPLLAVALLRKPNPVLPFKT